ncbi:MAG: right-handed parallel beta-helix repeat-containing protein [Candidatus Poribacteria bacterium]|nr:right-handed parallel beta-helix repeat-containing protein [Candidatus Poribacteria bacterium]
MSVTTLAVLCVANCLKRITHYILGFLIILIGCGNDTEAPLGHVENTTLGVGGKLVIELSGTLQGTTLKSTNTYKLTGGAVTVPSGKVLAIEPGTLIKGSGSPRSWLEVEIGAKIIAEGTRDAPIVFTSDKPEGSRSAGDWGGIVINGNGIGHYKQQGNTNDSSGVLRFVRIEYAGSAFGDGHLNGISLKHVGAGTIIEYLQVFEVLDDAIELYGGNVNLKHIVVSGFRDDGLDWTQGYSGTIQYLICHKPDNYCDRGIEGDNNPDAPNHQPRSKPEIYNATIVGMGNQGILLRNGSAGTITNCIVMNCGGAGLMVDSTSVNNSSAVDAMSFTHNIFSDNRPDLDDGAKKIAQSQTTLITQPQLRDVPNWDWTPRPMSPAMVPANANLSVSSFIGAIGTDDWTAGWVRRPD